MDQLKDVILSTLAEIQETLPNEEQPDKVEKPQKQQLEDTKQKELQENDQNNFFEKAHGQKKPTQHQEVQNKEDELQYLLGLRERMLVLFEGFQAPNNTALEAKIDLTLNFLEYVLASIDARVEKLKGK